MYTLTQVLNVGVCALHHMQTLSMSFALQPAQRLGKSFTLETDPKTWLTVLSVSRVLYESLTPCRWKNVM